MEEDKEETLKTLRDEVSLLKEQIARISNKLEVHENEVKKDIDEDVSSPEENEVFKEKEQVYPRSRYSRRSKRPKKIKIKHDWGDQIGEYIENFVEDVMDGVSQELEQSLFVARRLPRRRISGRMTQVESKDTADVMSALANEHRIMILSELSSGGMYASELQEALSEISPSTLNSHLDVLEDKGLIFQEKRRGRYLITISGRVAVKMAFQVMKRSRKNSNEDEPNY